MYVINNFAKEMSMHDYYYRGAEDDKVIIQTTGSLELPFSIRVSETVDADFPEDTAMVMLPEEELDRMIAGSQEIKKKIAQRR